MKELEIIRSKDSLHQNRITKIGKQIKKNLPKYFCAAPFSQIFAYPTGDVFVCCEGGGHLGNLKNSSIEELWNGPAAQALREEFLLGAPKQCQNKINCKGCNKDYDHLLEYTDLSIIQSSKPVSLDLIITGRCNIECVMCVVRTEKDNLNDLPNYHSGIIQKVIPQLKYISIKSGEPFIQREVIHLLNHVAETNPSCEWNFTTNGMYNLGLALTEKLKKVLISRVTFSIDSMNPDLFKKIRKKGELEKCLDTIQEFKNLDQVHPQKHNIQFSTNITLQSLNWKDLPETFYQLHKLRLSPSIIFLDYPDTFSLNSYSTEEKIEVLIYYLNLPAQYDFFFQEFHQALQSLLQTTNNEIRKIKVLLNFKLQEIIKRKMNICNLPFTQISIYPDGSLKPCCWLNQYDLSNGRNFDFMAAWNGPAMQKLRKDLLEENFSICGETMLKTNCHTKSIGRRNISIFDFVLEKNLPVLHWYFSGKCNLECPTCFNWHFNEEFDGAEECWETLKRDVLPYICEIEILGGEPFFQKRNYQLMRLMPEINPLCLWYFTTNGQIPFAGAIKEHIEKLRIASFSVSIDSLDPARFNQIRKNGQLQKTLNFLYDLIAYRNQLPIKKRFQININFVLQKDNWKELDSIISFTNNLKVGLYIIPMISPEKFSIYNLEANERHELKKYINELNTSYQNNDLLEINL